MTVFWLFWGVGVILQLLVIRALLKRQQYKRFPLLFLFLIVVFLTGIVDVSAFSEIGVWTAASRRYFWLNDAIRQSLMYALAISLVLRALRDSPLAGLRSWLLAGTVVFCLLSIILTSDPSLGIWMTTMLRNLRFFCAVVLNLALWLALVRTKRPDTQLLLVSGGIGLQMAGEAIGQSLRLISIGSSRTLITAGNTVLVISHLLCLYIWLQAFSRERPAIDRPGVRGSEHPVQPGHPPASSP